MRVVVQRVREARVTVAGETVGAIGPGLLAYVGAGRDDGDEDVAVTARKIVGLRIFQDEQGRMSRAVREVGGGVLLVPQFTLYGDVRRGRRPSFDAAAPPERARDLFERLVQTVAAEGVPVATGRFRTHMVVTAAVDGPVTILVDSRKLF